MMMRLFPFTFFRPFIEDFSIGGLDQCRSMTEGIEGSVGC
jgi:hypothetical protein